MRQRFLRITSLVLPPIVALAALQANAQNDSGFKFMEVKVVDPEGKPLADLPVYVRIDGSEFPMPTDEAGVVAFNVPTSDKTRLRLKVSQPGYVALAANWKAGDTVPEEYVFRMQKGTTIGGIIHDEQGQPIEGVQIEAHLRSNVGTEGGGKTLPSLNGVIATTDAEGRWRNDSAPAKRTEVLTDFIHPEYAHDNVLGYRAGNWEQLKSLKHIVVLRKGIELRGQVLDPDGLSVVGAKVTLSKGRYYSDEKAATTNEEGRYRITNVKPGDTPVTVLSADWAPETKVVIAEPGIASVDFQLDSGQTVRFEITDQAGQPVAGVKVTPDEWRDLEILPQSKILSDDRGIWEWDCAPTDAIQYRIYKTGYMSTSVKDITPRDQPYKVKLPPQLIFAGKVTDAGSGNPIEDFHVVEGIYWRESDEDVVWQQHRKTKARNGQYRVAYNSGYAGFKIKIEADGYIPKASRLVAIDEGKVNIDFELEAGSGPSGIVKLPNGRPANGTEVLMAVGRIQILIQNGEQHAFSNSISTVADSEGRFQLPIPEGAFAIVCLHDEGWAAFQAEEVTSDIEMVLEPWARAEGILLQGSKPLAGEQVSLLFQPQFKRRRPYVQWQYSAMTDSKGVFAFERARPGSPTIQHMIPFGPKTGRSLGNFSSHSAPCELVAGETTRVQIGGAGRKVVGRLSAPKQYLKEISWEVGRAHLNYWVEPPVQAGPKTLPSPKQIEEAKKGMYQRFAAPLQADGSFEIHDVPPGKYWLDAFVYQPRTDRDYNWDVLGRIKTEVTIPPTDEGESDSVDLGKHLLTITESTEPSK